MPEYILREPRTVCAVCKHGVRQGEWPEEGYHVLLCHFGAVVQQYSTLTGEKTKMPRPKCRDINDGECKRYEV